MIEDINPYPAYKDSGVPWLGEVPEHWEVRKLKYAVSFSGGGTPSKADALTDTEAEAADDLDAAPEEVEA